MSRSDGRLRVLALISMAVVLSMSAWFTATAIGPELQLRWGLGSSQLTWLTTLVQLGFVAGTALAVLLNLADILPMRAYFGASALLAAGANGLLLMAPGFESAAVLRFLTGVFLAGVYPPAMKMISTWYLSGRGFAIGTVVGALTLGKGAPYLIKAVGGASAQSVLIATSLAGVLGAVLVLLFYRDGPHPFTARPFDWGRVGSILRHRPTMLATGGYLGHMWELYAAWTFVPAFLHLAWADRMSSGMADLAGFAFIGAGGAGAILAGRWADRFGRIRIANLSMWISGGCALIAGWMAAAPVPLLMIVVLVWGFAVVADSAQFSALVTEVAPSHVVGTALTLQTMLGFALTAVTIQGAGKAIEMWGWGPAFGLLALGPAVGIWSMRTLGRLRGESRSPEGA